MYVTNIEAWTKTKYKVELDGEFAFVLYKGELSRYGIEKDTEISEELYQKLRTEIVLKRAKLRAMHLLEDMDRTEEELRRKLSQSLYPEDIIRDALEYVKSYKYLDDLRYAQNFILGRKDKKSRKEIYTLLLKKGIAPEDIKEAFGACYDTDSEKEAILSILRKRHANPEEMNEAQLQKIYGYLARKGFHYDTVRQVIQNYDDNA